MQGFWDAMVCKLLSNKIYIFRVSSEHFISIGIEVLNLNDTYLGNSFSKHMKRIWPTSWNGFESRFFCTRNWHLDLALRSTFWLLWSKIPFQLFFEKVWRCQCSTLKSFALSWRKNFCFTTIFQMSDILKQSLI